MDAEVKQRNRRRKRAKRMQAQREINREKDSGDEDIIPEKPPRPPNRRKKSKEPLCEEDIIDGFSILQFKTYEDLELVLKISTKENIKRLTEIERPKLEPKAHITHHITVHNNHGLTLSHDPATSDDSGRASERLTGSSVAPRDADSSRDRLSDASSRCSSGKGYICDSEGEDDKGSDASSVIFGSAPASRKHEFPGALPPSLPSLNSGASSSPVPAPTPPNVPVPSPAPAQQPPHHPPQAIPSAAVSTAPLPLLQTATHAPTTQGLLKPIPVSSPPPATLAISGALQPPPQAAMPSVPTAAASIPQPAAAAPASHHPPALDPTTLPGGHAMRTDSPAVATSANVAAAPSSGHYHHLYAPYAASTPYTAPAPHTPYTSIPTTATAAAPVVSTVPPPQAMPAPTQAAASPVMVQPHRTAPPINMADREPPKMRVPSPSPSTRDREPRERDRERERESYSSSVSSLSRSVTSSSAAAPVPSSFPPPVTTTVSSSLASAASAAAPPAPPPAISKPWVTVSSSAAPPAPPQLSPAPPRPTPPLLSSYPPPTATAPIFAAPSLPPPPVSTASPLATPPIQPNPNPFSAESLFQTNQTDMLRRELDNRFLASQDRTLPPYLRTEMHQHQHHHTHVHQHTTSLLPPQAASTLFPSPLKMSPMDHLARRSQSSFKDIPKIGSVESSPFYRQNLGMSSYPGYTPSLMHPGLTAGPTPFVPPNHLTSFQHKKTGKWNAMHVRVAWEIYHHQQKSGEAKGQITPAKPSTDLLRPPTHPYSPSVHGAATRAPHEMAPFPPTLSSHRPPPVFDPPHHPGSLFSATSASHLGKSPFATGASTLSPFTRYGGGPLGAGAGASPFSMSPFGPGARDSHLAPSLLPHDPWRSLQRTMPGFPPTVSALPPTLPGLPPPGPPPPWSIKPDPVLEQREREAREREERERERLRREREERERREREEKQRRLEQQQQERERREKERREMERREIERDRERERMHQQRIAEAAAKQLPPSVIRDRSPLRNGQPDPSEIRVKEEPRIKEEDHLMSRYHPYLRHPPNLQPPPSVLDRSRMMSHPSMAPHYPPPPSASSHWPPPPPTSAADAFAYHRYGGYGTALMDAMRDDRAAAAAAAANYFGAYGMPPHHGQLRVKDPGLMHLRPGPGPPQPSSVPASHKMSVTPTPADLHKKEEPR
ncbi:fibrosin-1-like protein isoform X3 [Aethina tumida]|uniref:fibrosin-1-like protein isoform X3 n=1 Tax=Aethina tumida TaxID=116153 RepID=UPI0021476705|nr:fibrosin-1-like protein isoform X3 [Aethina tumida]